MITLSTRARFALGNVLYPDISYNERMSGERIDPRDVARFSSKDLMCLPNVGKTTVKEIKMWLSQYGLCLADESIGAMWDR